MSDVEIGYGDSAQDTAVLLLAAADDLDLDPAVVRTVEGGFLVPEEVADKAGLKPDDDEDDDGDDSSPPAKKAAAKKAAK